MGRIFSWFFLLCKRVLKRKSFIVILCALPLLAFGVNRMAKEDGGILRIAVAVGPEADAVALSLEDSLFHQSSIIHYERVASEAEARKLVEAGKADAAWLIPDNLQQKIIEYVEEGLDEDFSILTVIEKEDNVALHLTREILFGKLYEPLAYEIYKQYVQKELLSDFHLTEDALWDAYYRWNAEENFFQFSYLDGETQELEDSYLLLPMRGLLALFIFLSGLAFSMYYIKEAERGCFVWTKMNSSAFLCWCYHIPEMLLTGLAVLPALYFMGMFMSPGREVLLLVLYSFMVIGFCDVLQRLCRKVEILGMMIPVIVILSLVLSPIFLKVKGLLFLKRLLPITYYLSALHENSELINMLIFIVIVYMLDCFIIWWQKNVVKITKGGKKTNESKVLFSVWCRTKRER